MEKEQELLFGTEELAKHLKGFLLAESSLAKGLLSEKLDQRSEQSKVLLGSCCQTAVAITKLCDEWKYFYSDAVILSRAFIEKIINFCYLLVCDKNEFDSFFKHTVQKSYRKLDRSISIGDLNLKMKFCGNIDLENSPLLKESLEEYTSKSGKEKTHWTSVSLENRIKLLSDRTNLNIGFFMMNTLIIYEDASESLHGTLYGCSYYTGAYEPNLDTTNPSEVEKNALKKVALLHWQLGLLFHETIILISEKNKINDILQGSKKNYKNVFGLMKRILEK
jgi:hypothetical protein